MGGIPIGMQWEAIYPLIDKLDLDSEAWNEMHDALMVMEAEALETMAEFAPKARAMAAVAA